MEVPQLLSTSCLEEFSRWFKVFDVTESLGEERLIVLIVAVELKTKALEVSEHTELNACH